jgi:cyclopropane fatty-acyl-phospholipid synthase-like methyltransferase
LHPNNNKNIYNAYFESSFRYSNILTEEEYENISRHYEITYGKVLPSDKNAKILDIGCGTGHFLYYLKKRGYSNFLGIDISPEQVKFCKQNISEKTQLADAFEFLKDKQTVYDVIVAHDFLEHIPKSKTRLFLNFVYTSLTKTGLLLIRVPNMSNPFSLDSRYRDFTHQIGFTEKSLYQLLRTTGFRNIQISSTAIQIRSFRNRVRSLLVDLVHTCLRFLYYIQDFTVPKHLGKNLIVTCRKQ